MIKSIQSHATYDYFKNRVEFSDESEYKRNFVRIPI